MEKQEDLRDYQGIPPELSLYKSKMTPHADPVLVFKDRKDGFWKARHYMLRETLDLKLTQRGFGDYTRVSDDEIQGLILSYAETLRNLKTSLEAKNRLSELEDKTKSAQELK